MVSASSRRVGRVQPKTRLVVYIGSNRVDNSAAVVFQADEPAEQTKNHAVGAKGVETGELLEHHLQAALSSASLLHSRDASKPESPASRESVKPDPAAGTTNATLNYHIPTPDATGLVDTTNYAKLYHAHKWVEPTNYIRFSDTVEESACGAGGLGYNMDDEDMEWLKTFNGKAEGASGDTGAGANGSATPASPSNNRSERRAKGKEKEKDTPPTPLHISEDTFEYIMGVLEKHAEDSYPGLHTDLSLMPTFQQVENLFSSPLAATFYPSNEVPKGLPESRVLTRIARSVFPHWKTRREKREGKSIMPMLNYDETNDNDPYVCFRRRDVRAARKTRRTDNYSVEQFQKLQFELRRAYDLSQLVLRRETEKKALYAAEKEVWEAKWKLFETKRRWPSLGVTRDEEEVITGRQNGAAAAGAAAAALSGQINPALAGGQGSNNARHSRKQTDKDKDERRDRDRVVDATRQTDRHTAHGKSMAPEAIRERLAALHSKLDEDLARRKAADALWDDYTDSSYHPLPTPHSSHAFRNIHVLNPNGPSESDSDDDDKMRLIHPMAFRMRRGRAGRVVLDRRLPMRATRRGAMPSDPSKLRDYFFPDMVDGRVSRRRPRSIDEDGTDDDDELELGSRKRQRLNEVTRYDASRGGAVGVGMGMTGDDDRVVLDDYDGKYIRHRIGLLQLEDLDKLRPDTAPLLQALSDLSAPVDLPPPPKFIKPAPTNPQLVAYQQQMLQQQQMEQLQRFQLLAQQQQLAEQARMQQQQQQQHSLAAQQAAQAQAAQAQAQAQAQAVQAVQATANGAAGMSTPNGTQMPPPNGVANGRPQQVKRSPTNEARSSPVSNTQTPTATPSNNNNPGTPQTQAQGTPQQAHAQLQQNQQQSPQVLNGMVGTNGKPFVVGPGGVPGVPTPVGALDPQIQQQRIAAARAQLLAQQQSQNEYEQGTPEQRRELAALASANGYGNNVQAFLDVRNRARLISMAKIAAAQQAQASMANGGAGAGAGGGAQQGQIQVPMQPINVQNVQVPQANFAQQNGMTGPGQLQLKLPAHAAARLAGNTAPPTPQAQAQRS